MTTTLRNLKALGRDAAAAECAYHRARRDLEKAASAERMALEVWQRSKERLAAGVGAYGVCAMTDPTAPNEPRSVRVERGRWFGRFVAARGAG